MKELGQLFVTGISGCELLDHEKEFLEESDIGGVIFFKENYESSSQLAELTNKIQTCRSEYPLFTLVDQEGGRVQRFKNQFSIIPSMYDLSLLDSPKIIFEVASIMAKELVACGINVNLAPVCDVWTNPANKVIGDRSFGTNTEMVEKNVSAAIRGFQTNGVLACGKHFPGHGDTKLDSHFNLPYVKTSMEKLEERELIPFIKASKSRVDFIMMAHLVVDAIDDKLPTTVSAKAYEFLRNRLKFEKIIITDDMHMGAITKQFTFEEAAIKALDAGADILEYRDMNEAIIAFNAVRDAIDKGILNKEKIQEKINRVMKVKKNKLSEYKPIYIPDISKTLGNKEVEKFFKDLNEKIAQVKENIKTS